ALRAFALTRRRTKTRRRTRVWLACAWRRSESGQKIGDSTTKSLTFGVGSGADSRLAIGMSTPRSLLASGKETVILRNSAFPLEDPNLLNKAITPSFIVKFLDQYVIGQEDAKKTV